MQVDSPQPSLIRPISRLHLLTSSSIPQSMVQTLSPHSEDGCLMHTRQACWFTSHEHAVDHADYVYDTHEVGKYAAGDDRGFHHDYDLDDDLDLCVLMGALAIILVIMIMTTLVKMSVMIRYWWYCRRLLIRAQQHAP